eukprot:m.918104 g.918104  ORF g.918104 m.918104 type:complete len:164 (+) comp60173_c0_seq1:3057-3548(+)
MRLWHRRSRLLVFVFYLERDNIRPTLALFGLDMRTASLSLSFDEPVDVLSLKATELTLQATADVSTSQASYTLTGGSTSSSNGLVVVVDLSSQDFNAIKARRLAQGTSSTFLSLTAQAIADVAFVPNAVVAIANTNGKQVSNFVADRATSACGLLCAMASLRR